MRRGAKTEWLAQAPDEEVRSHSGVGIGMCRWCSFKSVFGALPRDGRLGMSHGTARRSAWIGRRRAKRIQNGNIWSLFRRAWCSSARGRCCGPPEKSHERGADGLHAHRTHSRTHATMTTRHTENTHTTEHTRESTDAQRARLNHS